ncbi:hypothetical protein HF086_001038 [Spodoptera exigua]|uniref:Mannosyltransferase n=1 Tax=Spodoptera exigua TaxID=7107 RepID=A0A922M6T9_SPOEX|nr:hypothetical protein HF086_001038 [Spodoptera exigua]
MVQLLYIIASLHVLLCPFTKVEESFNIQATHDILYHRHNLSQYDHNEFPGVVPRTFIGPLVISALSAPVVSFFHLTGVHKFWMQYVVRLMLAASVIGAWTRLRNALLKQFGSSFAWWFTLITVTQYHFMFYMSRPLPNIMVLPLVLLAFEGWVSGKHKQFIVAAGASIVIFRAELAMLFGLFLIIDLHFKKIDLTTLFKIVVPTGVGLVALTVIVDSIFWGRLLWPEAEVFWYNTVMNKSSEWGTSPFLWYFYSALPRGLGPSLVLIPVGLYLDRRLIQYAAPAIVYILLYSFLPHKELRFIIYVFPLLNMASAAACSYVFHKIMKDEPFVHVHICNLAAQTGVTRFTQINDSWRYSKNESLALEQLQDYTHLLVEAKSKYSPNLKYFAQTHVILDSVESFSQVAMNYKLMPPVRIKTKPAIFILERKDFREFPHGHNLAGASGLGPTQMQKDEAVLNNEDVLDVVNYDNIKELGSKKSEPESDVEVQTVEVDIPSENESTTEDTESVVEEVTQEPGDNILEEVEEPMQEDVKVDNKLPKLQKAKKAFEDLKTLRQERKKKAIEKIKTETRKEVVESAKEKLKEIMKRHKHIAHELSENIISDITAEIEEKDGRGDIPETEFIPEEPQLDLVDKEEEEDIKEQSDAEIKEELIEKDINTNKTNENIDTIVEEVILRLIDRKIYDDKTKPEDIKPEDRLMIQKIVEEVISEKLNYSNVDSNNNK